MFQQAFYPHQQSQKAFSNNRSSTNQFIPTRPVFFRANQSTHNLHFARDFDRFPMSQQGFNSVPSGTNRFFDFNALNFEQQQRWRQSMGQAQQQKHRRTPAFHFRDNSTSYFMTEPMRTSDNRIAIQLTKVHIGRNGDQQRVFVEQEFSNEKELNHFVRNLRHNFEKTFNSRSSDQSSNSDEISSTEGINPGVVVVEEPDEEPRVYQQQAYNENIASKAASLSFITPPLSPRTVPSPRIQNKDHIRPLSSLNRPTKLSSSSISEVSSTSTTHSNRCRKNKMKFRRQKLDNRDEPNLSRPYPMAGVSRQRRATPTPPPSSSSSRMQQRFFIRDNNLHMTSPFHVSPNPNFAWRPTPTAFPKARSRSFIPTPSEQFSHPNRAGSRFQNVRDPFPQPMHSSRFAHHRQKESPVPPPSSKAHVSRHRQFKQASTVADSFVYPSHHHQQQPRVQRTKSESRHFENQQQQQRQQQQQHQQQQQRQKQQQQQQQQHRSRSTANHFQQFSPLQQPPNIQRHFTPFRSPPVVLPQVNTASSIFYPSQRRPFGNIQAQLHLINPFRLNTNLF